MDRRNNVIRMLESRAIAFDAVQLPDDSRLSAVEVADILGVPAEQVFKTIVLVQPEGGRPILALVPGPAEVDVKALGNAIGVKKVALPPMREAERLTGLQAGGISPLALLDRGFEVVLDEFARAYDQIYVSGGQRGLDIRIAVDDLIDLTGARLADIIRT